ncbi:PA4642 family protein [Pseudomonas sp.]|uniref:PA4642 family protein n=1 Tax=Pseudomonas sp. TaxID=306 RepID=UPI002729C4CD|nr:PA4642 family protein [Pseudomonas sp.]
MRKDKQKVIGEPMTDEQVAAFLEARPYADESAELHMLTRAYRGLRVDDFRRFLEMFKAAGHDLDARGADGKSFLDTLAEHAQAEEYIVALQEAGAR